MPTALTHIVLSETDRQAYPIEGFGLLSLITIGCMSAVQGLSKGFLDVWRAARDYRHRIKYQQLLRDTPEEPQDTFNERFFKALTVGLKHKEAWRHAKHAFRHISGGDTKVDVTEGGLLVTSNSQQVQQW